ncbi:hypothetical protein PIB30_095528 [Stylosanthes scabra]|uniref:Uncharacterized protein n=1 Tax=Stylosanthes scabra TaxID=79078 RepID=A0ABU6TWE2_9FABA|nr:hypothetical protein [Stylosanthes scabra]
MIGSSEAAGCGGVLRKERGRWIGDSRTILGIVQRLKQSYGALIKDEEASD